jgi:sulfhydrogenase subunit beta (sulfur reductase)
MKSPETRVLSTAALNRFLEAVMAERPVMGPRERRDQPGFYRFDWLETADDFAPEYPTTTLPPKKAFAAPRETLFTFTMEAPPSRHLEFDAFPFVLLGVHPCDLSGIDALDQAYSQPPAEARWTANRQRAAIIGLDCQPDPYCFCAQVGTEAIRRPSDLFLTPVADGYCVEIHSETGRRLLQSAETRAAGPADREGAQAWRERKAAAIAPALDAPLERLRDILDAGGLTPVWKDVAARCYSCGSCNTTCPTCFCFDMVDEIHPGLESGARYRVWDSCQLLDFAVVAGGHNFRGERWQRVRHRWQRKFLYLYRQFGRPYCTGCGRCGRACTADINIVDVSNRLVAAAGEEAK